MSDDSSDSDSEEEEIYNVECIVAESWDHERQKPLYLVKWEDYDLYEATWETQSSFEEGAEEVLRDWSEVKQQRIEGKIPPFDLEGFETKRARWLQNTAKADDAISNSEVHQETLNTRKQVDSDDSSESSDVDEPKSLALTDDDQLPRILDRNSTSALSPRPATAVAVPQNKSSSSSTPTSAMQAKDKGTKSTKSMPPSKPVQKRIEIDQDLYKMPESMSRYKTLNQSSKRNYKGSTSKETDTAKPAKRIMTHEPVSLGVPRVLPKFSKVGQLRANQQKTGTGVDLTAIQDVQQRDGVAHLSDQVSKDPQALYDVLVKVRERQWKLFISEMAFDAVIHDAVDVGNYTLQLDYQTLRQKQLISLHEPNTNILQIAAQERLVHLGEYNRYVVIRGEHEKWDYIPQGLEVFSVEHFRP